MGKDKVIELRIHHFYDIIRAFGVGKKMEPHPYGHSLHKVAERIRSNPDLEIKAVVSYDSACKGCVHYKDGHCDDLVSHRKDFALKEDFNNHIDRRIMEKCIIKEGDILTPSQLCKKAKEYLKNVDFIYLGDDPWHIKKRKDDVVRGLKYYSKLHSLLLDFSSS